MLRLFTSDRMELTVTDAARALGTAEKFCVAIAEVDAGRWTFDQRRPIRRATALGTLLFEITQAHQQNSVLMDLADVELRAICQVHPPYRLYLHFGWRRCPGAADAPRARSLAGCYAAWQPCQPRSLRRTAAPCSPASRRRRPLRCIRNRLAAGIGQCARPMTDLLRDRLARYPREGWCEAIDEAIPGVHSIALPSQCRQCESFAFCLPSQTPTGYPKSSVRRIVRTLTDAARRIAESTATDTGNHYQRSCGMRQLSADDIEALSVGAWILGAGGGGSPYHGLLNLRRALPRRRAGFADAAGRTRRR